jgi:transcription termination/antitermination protein NusG
MLPDNSIWIALYVKSRHEKVIATALSGKGYGAFVPLCSRRYQNGKSTEVPLFPSYVFCRAHTDNLLRMLMTPGVFSFVGNRGTPEAIPDDEIERVKRFVHADVSARPWPYITAGEKVTITSGLLKGITGIVNETSNQRWLVVSVNLVKQSIAVKLPRDAFSVDVC